jgi:histidinol-phosphate aminotransferase
MVVAAAGLGLQPGLQAQGTAALGRAGTDDYDSVAKLASNENPYGPSESVIEAMTRALKYANRYRYPDPGLVQAIATHDGVGTENVLLGAGSTEILHVAAVTFLQNGKKVIGVEPTFSSVYEFATGLKTNAIRLPLGKDYRQDTSALIKAIQQNARDIGLVYVCNPNNPTGLVVPKNDIKQLLDEIPRDIPVLIDEAYHDFVESAEYATSIPYVSEGRPVIIARTFSKVFGLAGMRLGYALAPAALINRMQPYAGAMSVNVLARFAGVAALRDKAAYDRVRSVTLKLRRETTEAIKRYGYSVIPSDGNFFMVQVRRPIGEVIQEFRRRGVLVGRPFPPMLEHLRVSIGTADEMERMLTVFREIFPAVPDR